MSLEFYKSIPDTTEFRIGHGQYLTLPIYPLRERARRRRVAACCGLRFLTTRRYAGDAEAAQECTLRDRPCPAP